jgi:predicted metal-dependent HD superfamily phosphohydrolase
MRDRWNSFCASSPSPVAARDAIFDEFVRAYSEPQRHYHTMNHVEACLDQFELVRDRCDQPDAVEAAIWFHDVVYDPRRSDNEQRSAELADNALRRLGRSDPFRQNVHDLILATRHDAWPVTTDDQAMLLDIDLSIFGATPAEFDEYERLIRREYAHVPDDQFRAGRAAILRRFLQRPSIFASEFFRRRYEHVARLNLEGSLKRLQA